MSIALVGSRTLTDTQTQVVFSVAASLVSSGQSLRVGCCQGADVSALAGACSVDRSAVSVFAAFGEGGVGACRVSAVYEVSAFATSGGSVTWWAGGVPSVPLPVRLVRRAQLVVERAASVVAFFGSASSKGTLQACKHAVALGLPVVAFFFGEAVSLGSGSWLPSSSFRGLPVSALAWQASSAQPSFF